MQKNLPSKTYADSEGPDQTAHPRSDLSLHCPLAESLANVEYINPYQVEQLRMLCSHMLQRYFVFLGAAPQLIYTKALKLQTLSFILPL